MIAGLLDEPAVTRAHWGIAVVGMDGAPIYSLNEGQLFQPASNTKLFTTSAAVALLGPQKTFETRVVARGALDAGTLTGDLVLVGGGDANLSGRTLPYVSPGLKPKGETAPVVDPLRYLAELADQVAAKGVKVVNGDVVGDDTYFPWEPYASNWAADDLIWGYGAPVSALSVNDNQIKMTTAPGAKASDPATVTLEPEMNYYVVKNEVLSSNPNKSSVGIDRVAGSKVIEAYGGIAVGATPDVEELAIADPAEYAAMALKQMLEARGVVVKGTVRAEHLPLHDPGSFLHEVRQPVPLFTQFLHDALAQVNCPDVGRPGLRSDETVLAVHTSVPLIEDVVLTNKISQNLHAEILLRNIGKSLGCAGRVSTGAQMVRQFLLAAGLDPDDFVFFDGSGLSGHDLVTPRATARLLQYAAEQPWFAVWKSSLPVGGMDGSLEARFSKSPLKGRLFAKTGTLGEARALSGYVECASGRTVVFSIMVGNHPPQTSADRDVMDKVVEAIAAAN
jgi:D-alanyl-D-alanine carboxypeptidase/D-alanyl-D-alanine-endopeptidase (penicillin-binding protein 4)